MSEALVVNLQYGKFPNARLNGCFYDGDRFIQQLKKMDKNIKITLMRDNLSEKSNLYPTKENIKKELEKLCNSRNKKLFFYYSGHGSYRDDKDGDEKIGLTRFNNYIKSKNSLLKDSCLVTNNINELDFLSDDEMYDILKGLNKNQKLYSFMDCCHSGTILDLPYIYMGDLKRKVWYRKKYHLIRNSLRNCRVINSSYKTKNELSGNIILFSGTRDNAYSYESNLNGQSQGHFTTALCKAFDLGLYKNNLRIFYTSLIGLLNNNKQIPVLSTSKKININKFRLYDLSTKSKLSYRQKLLLLKNIKKIH